MCDFLQTTNHKHYSLVVLYLNCSESEFIQKQKTIKLLMRFSHGKMLKMNLLQI